MSKYFLISLLLFVSTFKSNGQLNDNTILDNVQFEINNVDFNTKSSDFGPSLINNELWFSAYPDKDISKALVGNMSKVFYKLFKVPTNNEGETVSAPREIIVDFETKFHEGPASYCAKTGELFLTLSNSINVDTEVDGLVVKKKKMRLRLVVAKLTDTVWKIQEEMPFNDPIYSVGHPSVTPSGDTLFFTSDVPSTIKGKTDIYMVIRQNGVWGTPINLGDNINTTADEMFPFYHPSGILIFASSGHPEGKGGLDLYYSKLTATGFTKALPITQLNSSYDDFGLIINNNVNVGYFVSNRPGQAGNDDIYKISIKNQLLSFSGIVVNDFDGIAIQNATVDLLDCNNTKLNSTTSDNNGNFSFDGLQKGCYKVSASKTNFSNDLKSFDSKNKAELRLKQNKLLEVLVLDFDSHKPIPKSSISMNGKESISLKPDALFSFTLLNDDNVSLMAKANGYLNKSIQIQIQALNPGTIRDTIFMMKKEMNKTFVLDNIYYNLDKWDILPSSEIELNKLITIMQENPTIKVELGSHTDSRGSDAYNMTLSQKRSESAVAYIVKNGIPKNKISAKGYGESKLINRCANGVPCSDEEHRKNRRTEFKIIGM